MLGIDYSRFSDEKQGSIPEQQGINDETADEAGVSIVPEGRFKDEGVSRSIGNRPGLMAAFDFLRENPAVRYLIVNELERLTAGAEQRVAIASLCKTLNITILTEDMGSIDPHDETKMVEADERAIKSKSEVVKVRRRTRRNLRQKVINGTIAMRPAYGTRMVPLLGPDGNPLPAGVRLVDVRGKKISSGKLEIHPEELPWLLKIYEWSDEGHGVGPPSGASSPILSTRAR